MCSVGGMLLDVPCQKTGLLVCSISPKHVEGTLDSFDVLFDQEEDKRESQDKWRTKRKQSNGRRKRKEVQGVSQKT